MEYSGAVRAAAAIGAGVPAAWAGVCRGVGVVATAAAIGAAMPAGAASAGNRDHVAVGGRRNGGERQGVGAAHQRAENEGRGDQSVHEASPDGLMEIRQGWGLAAGERHAGADLGDRLIDQAEALFAMA